jgi:two-component system cell cycle sensor histidine kinase/response regulator CckA
LDEFAQLQEHILRSAAGAADLTKKLLALSRQQTLNRQSLDVGNWLTDCLPMARSVLGEDIDLSIDLAASGSAYIDALQMERTLLNLLINARDAMTDGGKINIRTALHDSADLEHLFGEDKPQDANQYLEISVEDTGSGIPESDLERIFEPFFSTKGAELGSGLGLAVTAGIVDQHEGFVRAENLAAGGAVVRIYLPLQQDSSRPQSEARQGFSCQGLRVLLVDDEEMVRELCRSFLEADGAIIAEASSGQAAIDALKSGRFDLVIMDVVMPELSGNEAAKLIREIEPEQRFLFVTGFAGSQAVLADLAHEKVLPKPFRRAELLSAISDVMTVSNRAS